MKRIAIIGGGAAGLAAAICAAHEARLLGQPVQVRVFEEADRVGKSILATGNGRCNFSNAEVSAENYYNSEFVSRSFSALPPEEVFSFFHRLGLLWHEESQGRLYPLSNKASSVLDVLRFAMQDFIVELHCNSEIATITPDGSAKAPRFLVSSVEGKAEFFDAVIVACGGKVARSLLPPDYRYLNTQPLLAPLKTNTDAIKGLNNIRVRCEVRCERFAEYGEVLFRDYGISGIVVFDSTRFVEPGETIYLDFLPTLELHQVIELLRKRFETLERRNGVDFCAGILVPPVARAVLKMAGIAPDRLFEEAEIDALAGAIKVFPLEAKGIEDYRQAQVQRGGFEVEHFDSSSMESLRNPGLFVVGEALDVDGPCGGYNLHWAWTSGILAGRAAVATLTR